VCKIQLECVYSLLCCSDLEERAAFLSYSALCGKRYLGLPHIGGK